jgi:hypothetical protein
MLGLPCSAAFLNFFENFSVTRASAGTNLRNGAMDGDE